MNRRATDDPPAARPLVLELFTGPLPGVDIDALQWTAFRTGVEIVRLYGDGVTGPAAALLRYQPGASVTQHRHDGYEHILVLRGVQSDDRGDYPAGTLIINPPDTTHSIFSREGCIVLVIWERPVTFTCAGLLQQE